MTYKGLDTKVDANEPHLGGNFKEGDPFTFCSSAWKYAIDRFAIKSILDLGSGLGYASSYFSNQGLQVIAIDGLKDNVDNAIFPTILQDLSKSRVYCKVDLVHCQELVEHIEEKYLDNLLSSLTCGKFILMTHALPGQGGYHHVNEQPAEYWIANLARYNCHVLEEDSRRIRSLAAKDGASYLARTGLVFANKAR